ncbi:MAG: AAA family ATPase [Candidatus Woesearchaeota archaeon]
MNNTPTKDLEHIAQRVSRWESSECGFEPGMIVRYNKNDASTGWSPKTFTGMISKIIYYSGVPRPWQFYIEGEPEGHNSDNLSSVSRFHTPKIRTNEVYDILIPRRNSLPELISAILSLKLPEKKTQRIRARVITQSSLANDSVVYLRDIAKSRLYVISASALDVRGDTPTSLPRATSSQSSQGKNVSGNTIVEKSHREQSVNVNAPVKHSFSSPAAIAERLGSYVLHQEDATKSLSVAVYDQLTRSSGIKKSNVLIVGPTGTGKTELARTAARLLDVPFAEAKLAGVSTTGYKDANLLSMFDALYPSRNAANVARSVFFLDEIDKLVTSMSGTGFGSGLQNELISWVESARLKVPIDQANTFDVDTTNMLFVAAGAFVGLESLIEKRLGKGGQHFGFGADTTEKKTPDNNYLVDLYHQLIPDDLVKYGLKPELIGRFPIITFTKPLEHNHIVNIIKRGKDSIVNQQIRLLQEGYHLKVDVDEQVYHMIADATLRRGTGARGIESISNKLFENIKFNIEKHTQGKTALVITPPMAYDALKRFLPDNYKI